MIHHFYHIYADGGWQQPVQEHIRALRIGLIDNLTTFAIGLVGSEVSCSNVKQYLESEKIVYTNVAEQRSGWEQVTQTPMWEFCQDHEGFVLYAHTKGASNPSDVNIRWRRSMTYWNVIRWQYAVEKLKDHDAYGCHWLQPRLSMPEHKLGNWMFAGTFFWLKCDVLARFPKPALTHRHEAEGFVGYGWHEKPFKVYDPTPYFPNTGPFADGWIDNPNFVAEEKGVSV